MKRRYALPVIMAASSVLSGCMATAASRDPAYAPVHPEAMVVQRAPTGGIYHPGTAMTLFEDQRARRIGDLITIKLAETTSASKKANTNTKKETAADITAPTLLGLTPSLSVGPLRNMSLGAKLGSKQKFAGEGDSAQENSLSGSITVMVTEVLPNGNMLVRGEKVISLNQGDEFVRVAGIVRPQDIRADNTIYSWQLADAQISYGGDGVLADTNRMGWLARFFSSGWWPF